MLNEALAIDGWERPGFLTRAGSHLTMDGVNVVALAAAHGTPLHIYSERRIRETARSMLSAIAAHHRSAQLFFAAKACSAMRVLRILREEGCAIEVNSGGELYKARLAGFAPDRIIFNGVAKSDEEIAEALSPPIKAINVDSLCELERIGAVARRLGAAAKVALRLVPGLDSATSPGNRTGTESTKFGILPAELDAALGVIAESDGTLLLRGLHAHAGSQITDPSLYVTLGKLLAVRIADVEARMAGALEHLNIGGGFPLSYWRGSASSPEPGYFRTDVTLETIAAAVLPQLAGELRPGIEVLIEPGRSLIGEAAVLLSRVTAQKRRAGEPWLLLDAGYNALVESFTYKWYYHALTANRIGETPTARFRLAGPLCDSGDAFHDVDGEATFASLLETLPGLAAHRADLARRLVRLPSYRELPAATGKGDLIAFLDCGAYVLDQMTPNNGRPRPAVLMISQDSSIATIRRRDSYSDLLFNEDF